MTVGSPVSANVPSVARRTCPSLRDTASPVSANSPHAIGIVRDMTVGSPVSANVPSVAESTRDRPPLRW